jgi:lipid-binding SYLF domain-containing protein
MSQSRIKTTLACALGAFFLSLTLPAWSSDQSKDEDTLKKAGAVLQAMFAGKAVPAGLLATANCIIVLPGVKTFAVGLGKSGGRGPMTCRKRKNLSSGKWSAPAMYTIGGASAGVQVGGSSTDFVLLLMSPAAVDKVLAGKVKVGNDLTAGVGHEGSTGWVVGGTDIVTYGRSKGLFAGASLNGASLEPDPGADQRLYQKAVSAREIVLDNAVQPTPAGQSLVSVLDRLGTP